MTSSGGTTTGGTRPDGVDLRSGRPRSAARARAGQQGLLFTDDLPVLPEDMGYRGPTACSAAGITYRQLDYWARTGLVEPGIRSAARLGQPAALRLPRHPGAQGGQAAAGHRGLAAEHPHRRRPPARARRRRPGPDHADERRRERLRVHVRRRGRRPGAGRPGRLRHRGRPGVARGRGIARRAARASAPVRTLPRATRPSRQTSSPKAGPTSSRPVAAPAAPADHFRTHDRPAPHPPPRPARSRVGRPGSRRGLDSPRSRSRVGEIPSPAVTGRRRGNIPGTSQAPGPRGRGSSGATATEGDRAAASVLATVACRPRCPGGLPR